MSARVETVGSLIVDLRSNAAQFTAEMNGARKTVNEVGSSASKSQKDLARFASQGLGAVIPEAAGLEHALSSMISKALAAGGILRSFGEAGLIVAGILAVAAAVQKLEEEWRNFASLGETSAQTLKRINDEIKENQALLAKREQARGTELSLQKELLKLAGDEVGLVQIAAKEREAMILKTLDGAARQEAMAKSEQILLQQTRKIQEDAQVKLLEDIQKAQDAQVAAWAKETTTLVSELQKRVAARQAFEAQLGTGGFGGTTALSGLREASELTKKIQAEMRDIAGADRLGKLTDTDKWRELTRVQQMTAAEMERLKATYAEFPSVLQAIDAAAADVAMGNWTSSLVLAEQWARENIKTDQELTTQLGALAAKLAETLPATEAATAAIRQASSDYLNLANSIYTAVSALSAYNQTVAGG